MSWLRRKREPEQHEWFVEIMPGSWLVRYAPTANQARVAAFQLAPNGKGPWTVLTRAEHDTAWTSRIAEHGSPRFYRLGQHPATYRMRRYRAQLVVLPETPEREQALDYIDRTLAAFDKGEDEAMRLYLAAVRG